MAPDLQMVFQTRYSFFGASGWRSASSREKDLLFDRTRLAKRFDLFQKMNLACLRDQTDREFKLVVLTSLDLPKEHDSLLQEACYDVIGPDRTHILRRAPGGAGEWLRKYTRNQLNQSEFSAQIVLDDDDAVSADFVERCRDEAGYALGRFRDGQECVYLSFATGFTGLFHDDGGVDLIRREMPFTNLGLTLVAPTRTRKNPYMLAHKKVARRHDVRVFHEQRPFFIRAIHDTNDSRGHRGDVLLDADAVKSAINWFPLLKDLDMVKLRNGADAAA